MYNHAHLLRQAVESALGAGFADVEVVIVEDGSSDGSLAVARALAEADPRVTVARHADGGNHGPGVSLNLGIAAATAPYVCFLCSDDVLLPGRFDRAVQILDSEPGVDGVYEWTLTEIMDGGEARRGTVRPVVSFECDDPDDVLATLVSRGRHWSTDAIMVRRRVLHDLGGFSEDQILRGVEDLVLWLKLAAAARLVMGRREPVAVYRLHGSNLSSMDTLRQLRLPLRAYREAVRWARASGVPRVKRRVLERALADKLFYCCGELRARGEARLALRELQATLGALPVLSVRRLYWGNLAHAAVAAVRAAAVPSRQAPRA